MGSHRTGKTTNAPNTVPSPTVRVRPGQWKQLSAFQEGKDLIQKIRGLQNNWKVKDVAARSTDPQDPF